MPSEDRIDPRANEWMGKSHIDTGAVSDLPREPVKADRHMAAQVQRLALRTRQDPDAIASKIPADTLRRLKYPVLEQVAEDGTRTFKHDRGIDEDRPISLPRL